MHEINQYMKVFISKYICNNLYLFPTFIIYLQSPTKVFSTTGTSHRMPGSSVKSITTVTFEVNAPGWYVSFF